MKVSLDPGVKVERRRVVGYGEDGGTYAIHGEVVPDAVLPALGVRPFSFIGVRLEPLVDVSEYHRVAISIQERFVDELCIGLLLVDRGVIHAIETMRISGRVVVRCGVPSYIRVGTVVVAVVLALDMHTILVLVLLSHLCQLLGETMVRKGSGVVRLRRVDLVRIRRICLGHADVR